MKKLYLHPLLYITLFFTLQTYAQQNDFAPIGAKWHYSMVNPWSPPPPGYPTSSYPTTIESLADTTVMGKVCRKLKRYPPYFGRGETYLYSDSNRVYIFNSIKNKFYILYDYNAQEGDVWEFYIDTCYFKAKVDSVGKIILNNDTLKTIYIYDSTFRQFNGKIIEKIGHTTYMIPDIIECFHVVDADYYDGWRCYQDSLKNYTNPEWKLTCDTQLVGIGDKIIDNNVLPAYPNPMDDYLFISIPFGKNNNSKVEIRDLLGTLINTRKSFINETLVKIDTRELHAGFYIISVFQNRQKNTFKIIKTK